MDVFQPTLSANRVGAQGVESDDVQMKLRAVVQGFKFRKNNGA